ncbi:MAG: lysophospholipid acyltransferase family protein [Chloroflexota bacterium]
MSAPGPGGRTPGPSPFRYHLVRLVLAAIAGAYVRIRVEGAERLPASGGYIACFNHPSWLDPIVLAAAWPDRRRRLFVFGPREEDMSTGARNRIITWTGRGIPFRPHGADARDAARRSVAVLRAGQGLAIAGEGRLSDAEGVVRPLETGVGHIAQLAGVPVVPVGIVGTRWVRFGKRIRVVIGDPVGTGARGGGRDGARALTEDAHAAIAALIAGATDGPRPGGVGAWRSEAFNDRPWLDAAPADPAPGGAPDGPAGASGGGA